MSRHVLLTAFFFISSFTLLFGQSSIIGKVVDGTNNEPIENAKVYLLNTDKKTLSNTEGVFNFESLEAGTYAIEIRFTSFNTKVITDIELSKKQDLELLFSLEPADKIMGPVVVKRTVNKESSWSYYDTTHQ